METCKVGKRGTVVIPAALRRHFSIKEGTLVIAEATAEGVLLRPAIALPIETYSLERQAEFLLSNAIDAEDYQKAKDVVYQMGLNPDNILHYKPIKD